MKRTARGRRSDHLAGCLAALLVGLFVAAVTLWLLARVALVPSGPP